MHSGWGLAFQMAPRWGRGATQAGLPCEGVNTSEGPEISSFLGFLSLSTCLGHHAGQRWAWGWLFPTLLINLGIGSGTPNTKSFFPMLFLLTGELPVVATD